MDSCFNQCESTSESSPVRRVPSKGTVQLLCRDSDALAFQIMQRRPFPNKSVDDFGENRQYMGFMYLLQLHEGNKDTTRKHAYIVSI